MSRKLVRASLAGGRALAKQIGDLQRKELDALDSAREGSAPSERAAAGETGPTRGTPEALSIRIDGLWKVYERLTRREIIRTFALRDVNFEVDAKEFVALIGPSGCGKTTALKVVAGLLKPTKGAAFIGDKKVKGPGTDRAMVFQSPGLMPWRKVKENVILALEFADVPSGQREERADRYIDLVGLGDFHDHYPGELSGGMQQRVGIARALAIQPNVLLMDEPFGALDALTRAQMQSELLRIWEKEKRTVLFVTHSMDEAIMLSDRIIVMKNGTISKDVAVDIPRPRSREGLVEDKTAIELKRELVRMLA
jgi:NitT/TauT family transport system ATP-binding protein